MCGLSAMCVQVCVCVFGWSLASSGKLCMFYGNADNIMKPVLPIFVTSDMVNGEDNVVMVRDPKYQRELQRKMFLSSFRWVEEC